MRIFKGNFGKDAVLKHVTLDGVRLHLRTDEKKLWINGYYVLYLNNTATFIIESLIDSCYETEKEKVFQKTLKKILDKFKVEEEKAEKDLQQIVGIINSFARNEPPTNLVGMKVVTNEILTAPNRMDISLTYECNNNCAHCYLPNNKMNTGLPTEKWKKIIDKLWEVGVPQIVFTGGECTLRPDLVELVEYSKKFLTGIITNGTMLQKFAYDLKKAELDWIQITLESPDKKVHDAMQGRKGAFEETIAGIKECIKEGLQVSINSTITKKNYKDIKKLIDLASKLGVKIVSTNAIINSGKGIKAKSKYGITEEKIEKILKSAKDYANKKGIEFNWFLPTCYKKCNPVKLGFGQRCCSACSINMMIEPNGNVIPCQSWTHETLGNILEDDWISIWNHPTAEKLRNFKFAPDKCSLCKYLAQCGGSCPLEHINKRCRCH